MKFLDILLVEGRKEDLKKKYYDKFDEDVLDFVLGIADLQDFNHKYTDFVLKVTDPEIDASPEWFELVIDSVKMFDKYQSQLQKKDINQYSSFWELEKALSPFKTKEQEKELENQTEKIYEDDNFLVIVPKTIESSCKYGSGTKWCTTSKSGDHFRRYTSGNQVLYYILRKKGNQTEPHYKIAVHIDNVGTESWWDARDQKMNIEATTLFKDYFPEIYSEIIENSKEKRKLNKEEIDKIFESQTYVVKKIDNFKESGKSLEILLEGFDRIPDMPGRAMGFLKINLDSDLIDAYDVYVHYETSLSGELDLSVGFGDDVDFEPKFDFEFWKSSGIDGSYQYTNLLTHAEMRKQILDFILNKVYVKIFSNENFEGFVKNISGPFWRPDRHNYGYTFGKNKGLIKKLVDYLDAGYDNGTKLDFLEYIGKLKSKIVDGKKQYSHSYSDVYHPSSQWRGHFASFFASAKNAGIIQYTKDPRWGSRGSKFIIKPGPNFEAFKKGELKAL